MLKSKVLISISNYLPGYKIGGPLSSVSNMIDILGGEYDFSVITSDRDMGDSQPYPDIQLNKWLQRGNHSVFYVSRKALFPFRLIRSINKAKKDILYLNSLFDPWFSIFLLFAKRFGLLNAPVIIIAPRGELFSEALAFKSLKKTIYLRVSKFLGFYKHVRWHASTEFEKERIIAMMNVKPDNIKVAINLVRTDKETKIDNNSDVGMCQTADSEVLNIVYLARVSKDKNIPFTLDVLKMVNVKVKFDIYGPIEDNYIWNICLEKIKALPANVSVEYRGYAKREKVREIISQYDLFFLPTFAENFGHSIVESLLVGTPVLISDRTPWRNLEREGLGWDISLDDPDKFVEKIHSVALLTYTQRSELRKNIMNISLRKFSDPAIADQTKSLFNLTN
jgi:glycosyltransferase involved in cell wall biosynthesis